MGRHKGFKHTEEVKEKLRIARQKYLEKTGTLFDISERENPREYQRAYQKRYRELNPDYYRSRYKKKNEIIVEGMTKLTEIQNVWNEIVTSAIANEYNKFEKQTDILPLVEKLHEMLTKYASEVKEEASEDANK